MEVAGGLLLMRPGQTPFCGSIRTFVSTSVGRVITAATRLIGLFNTLMECKNTVTGLKLSTSLTVQRRCSLPSVCTLFLTDVIVRRERGEEI